MKNSLAFCWIVKYYRFDVVVEDVVVVSWTARERFVLDPNLGLFAPMNNDWFGPNKEKDKSGLANNYFCCVELRAWDCPVVKFLMTMVITWIKVIKQILLKIIALQLKVILL